MSTISLLPLVKVVDGVQPDEDWQLTLAYFLDDGATPVDISALTFSLRIGALATVSSASGQIAVSGPFENLLVITVLAATKASWPIGPIRHRALRRAMETYSRDLFARSTLAVGGAQTPRVSLVVAPELGQRAIVAPVSAALAAAFQALQPSAIVAALASLAAEDLQTLAQALIQSLPVQTGAISPVPAGRPFVNFSGYVVVEQ